MSEKSEDFEGIYQAEDGYVGGSRPQRFRISVDDIEDDMTDDDLRNFYQECMQDAFEQTVYPVAQNEDEFVEWARGVLKEREGMV